jgi:phage antirepressor YoqD-like protein
MKQEQQHKDLMRRAVRHLLVTDDDVMNEAERIVGHTLQRENQGDEGCLTVTEIARELDMEARDLNSFLRDMGIQRWRQGQYRLTPKYEGRGLTHDRLFIYYSTKDGKKKRQTYLVWTPKGLEFIRKLIKGKGTKSLKV